MRGWVIFLGMSFLAVPSAALWAQPKTPATPAYVEDSQEALDLVGQAHDLRQSGRVGQAAERYQHILETLSHKLIETSPRVYADVVTAVTQRIAGDAELLAEYRTRLEPIAADRFMRATDQATLELIVDRYALTPSAMEAALRLAGILLESAQPRDAAALLDRFRAHPDHAIHAAQWWMLRGTAARMNGDAVISQSAIDELGRLGVNDAARQLIAWVDGGPRRVVWSPTSQLPTVALPEQLEQPGWLMPLMEFPAAAANNNRARVAAVQPVRPEAVLFEPVPVCEADVLYVHMGMKLRAVDRASGRSFWEYEAPEPKGEVQNPWMRMMITTPDHRGVALSDGRAIAVMGAPLNRQMQYNLAAMVGAWVSAVSARDGSELWRIAPKDIDESLASASFYGTPLTGDGRTYVLLRRSQMGGFQTAFVVALDSATGKPLWRRYLSSAAANQQFIIRPMSLMTMIGSRLVINDQLGSVACVDARDGSMLWLHTLPAPATDDNNANITLINRSANAVPQASAPILTAAGLVITPLLPTSPARLLNPENGTLIKELPGAPWTQCDYLASAGGDILCIGTVTTLIDGTTLKDKWSVRLSPIKGRAAVLSDQVLLPLGNRVISLSLANGGVKWEKPVARSGSLFALPDQLLITDTESVRSHMVWARAYARLKADLQAAPTDPNRGLALAHLATTARQNEAVLEGVDAAFKAVTPATPEDKPSPQHTRVFRQVLVFAEMEINDSALRYSLYDRLAQQTTDPGEEVVFQLSRGSFLAAMGNAQGAVDHFQAVLVDPTLASQLVTIGGTTMQAGIEGRARLIAVVKQAGPAVYARYDATAAQRLGELTPRGMSSVAPANAAALLELARQYPMATAAPAAVAAAGEALAAAGDKSAALSRMSLAFSQTKDAKLIAHLGGRIAEINTELGQSRKAKRWLDQFRRLHPNVMPLRDGKPTDAAQWATELSGVNGGSPERAQLTGPISRVEVLPGRLLSVESADTLNQPTDSIIISHGDTIEMRHGADLAIKWTTKIPVSHGPATLLWHDNDQVVLWMSAAAELIALDARTGHASWPALDSKTAISPPDEPRDPRDEAIDEAQAQAAQDVEQAIQDIELQAQNRGAQVMLRVNGRVAIRGQNVLLNVADGNAVSSIRVRVNDEMICIATTSGKLAGVDRLTGKVVWRTTVPIGQLSHFTISQDHAAVAGISPNPDGSASASTLILDIANGRVLHTLSDIDQPPTWIGLSSNSLLIRVMFQEVVANHAVEGQLAWRLPIKTPNNTGMMEACLNDTLLLVQESEASVMAIDSLTGQVLGRIVLGQTGISSRMVAQNADGLVHVLAPGGLVAMATEGTVRWRDALIAEEKIFLQQLVSNQSVVALALVPPPAPPGVQRVGLSELRLHVQGMRSRDLFRQSLLNRRIPQPESERLIARMGALPPPSPAGWYYRIYLFDRDTGTLTDSQAIGPIRDVIDTTTTVLLDGRIALTTGNNTVILHGQAK